MSARCRTGTEPERQRPGMRRGSRKAKPRVPAAPRSVTGWLKPLRGTRGAQLLEFALALPFLLVFLVGITNFGQAYNLKHILTNAAAQAARITVSSPLSDSSGSCQSADPPCSIQAAAEAVKTYLTNARLSSASCITPGSQSSGSLAALTWTYACNSVTLTINRGYVFTGTDGHAVSSTQVTLSYPYTWTFQNVIGLLVSGAKPTLPATLTSSVVMQNLD